MVNIMRFGGGGTNYYNLTVVTPIGVDKVTVMRTSCSVNDDNLIGEIGEATPIYKGDVLVTTGAASDNYLAATGVQYTVTGDTTVTVTPGALTPMYSLEETSWEIIGRAAELGIAQNYWSVGDTKSLTMSDGGNYQVRIIGFNHDTKTAGGLANITFEYVWLYSEMLYANGSTTDDPTYYNGWSTSLMKLTHMPDIFSMLPEDLQDVIVAVNKSTGTQEGDATYSITSGTPETTSEKVWLFSPTELNLGDYQYNTTDESSCYAIYEGSVPADRIKYIDSEKSQYAACWTHSPRSYYLGGFCYLSFGGNGNSSSCASSRRVCPCFCV